VNFRSPTVYKGRKSNNKPSAGGKNRTYTRTGKEPHRDFNRPLTARKSYADRRNLNHSIKKGGKI